MHKLVFTPSRLHCYPVRSLPSYLQALLNSPMQSHRSFVFSATLPSISCQSAPQRLWMAFGIPVQAERASKYNDPREGPTPGKSEFFRSLPKRVLLARQQRYARTTVQDILLSPGGSVSIAAQWSDAPGVTPLFKTEHR